MYSKGSEKKNSFSQHIYAVPLQSTFTCTNVVPKERILPGGLIVRKKRSDARISMFCSCFLILRFSSVLALDLFCVGFTDKKNLSFLVIPNQ